MSLVASCSPPASFYNRKTSKSIISAIPSAISPSIPSAIILSHLSSEKRLEDMQADKKHTLEEMWKGRLLSVEIFFSPIGVFHLSLLAQLFFLFDPQLSWIKYPNYMLNWKWERKQQNTTKQREITNISLQQESKEQKRLNKRRDWKLRGKKVKKKPRHPPLQKELESI